MFRLRMVIQSSYIGCKKDGYLNLPNPNRNLFRVRNFVGLENFLGLETVLGFKIL